MHLPARGHMKSLLSVRVAAQLLGRWLGGPTPPEPPLCKGRWLAAGEKNNPSPAPREPPLHKGAFLYYAIPTCLRKCLCTSLQRGLLMLASPVQGEVARRRRVGGVGKASLFIQKRKSPKAFSQYTYYNHVWCFILVFLLLPSALSYLPLFLWGKGEVQWAS